MKTSPFKAISILIFASLWGHGFVSLAHANCTDDLSLTEFQREHVQEVRTALNQNELIQLKQQLTSLRESGDPLNGWAAGKGFEEALATSVRNAITYVAKQEMSAAEKDILWNLSVREIQKVVPAWKQKHFTGKTNDSIYMANDWRRILLIDPHGNVWRGGNNGIDPLDIFNAIRNADHPIEHDYYRGKGLVLVQ